MSEYDQNTLQKNFQRINFKRKQPSEEVDKDITRQRKDPSSHFVTLVWLWSFIIKVLPK